MGTAGCRDSVVEIVYDYGRIAALDQNHGADGWSGAKTRVKLARGGFARFAVQPDNQELLGVDRGSGGKRPLREICVIVGEEEPVERDRICSTVVEFHPGIAVAEMVHYSVGAEKEIVRKHFIQPQGRERRQAGADGIRSPGCEWILRVVGGRESHSKNDVAACYGRLVNLHGKDVVTRNER